MIETHTEELQTLTLVASAECLLSAEALPLDPALSPSTSGAAADGWPDSGTTAGAAGIFVSEGAKAASSLASSSSASLPQNVCLHTAKQLL